MKEVSNAEAIEIIEKRKPFGKFFTQENNLWVGIDNTDGDAWTEEFSSFEELDKWMKGE